MYVLLSAMGAAAYYMGSGTANREGSGLAEPGRGDDRLILTSEWDNWNEPNDSMKYGAT